MNKGLQQDRSCNCRVKTECPLRGKCCTKTVIYRADINVGENRKNYIGCTEGEFKTRYNGHTCSFRDKTKRSSTTLSSLVWEKGLNPKPPAKWSIIKKVNKYTPGSRNCDLCLTEKLYILKADQNNINKRNEATHLCVHRNKFKFNNFKCG